MRLDFLKKIPSEVVPEEVLLFLKKSKAELVLTNLKTFDTFVFHHCQNDCNYALIMNRRRCQKLLF